MPSGKWYLRKQINGRQIKHVLDVDKWTKPSKAGRLPAEVVAAAEKVIAEALAGVADQAAQAKGKRNRVATIGEILDRYETHDRTQGLKESTRTQNVNDFTRVIATALNIKTTLNQGQTYTNAAHRRRAEFKSVKVAGSKKAAERRRLAVAHLSANVLTEEMVLTYVRKRIAEGPKVYAFEERPAHLEAKNGKLNPLDLERVQRTIAGELKHARAIFAEKSPVVKNLICPVGGIYKDMRLPDTLKGFTHCFTFNKPDDPEYKLPGKREMAKLWGALDELKATKPEVWKGFLIAVDTGLRLDEFRFLMWTQITELPKMVQIMVEPNGVNAGTKSKKARPVKLGAALYRELCDLETSGTYVIGGGHEFRKNELGREIAKFMRANGWTRRQCSHEMRKWFGAQLADKTKDLVKVMHVLGHADYSTTKGTYEAMVNYPEYEDITGSLLGKPTTRQADAAAA